jgi:N-acetylmuramoyl-L-alanine amidase
MAHESSSGAVIKSGVQSPMGFPADSFLVTDVVPSPNHGERRHGRAPDMILLHYTGMKDADSALDRLCARESEVSTHYFVFEDGRIVQCVPEAQRAWHAGVSAWAGEDDINSCSIGIEIANPGHDFGYPDFPKRQIAAVITLCRTIISRRGISADRVLAHSDVAPSRKQDPGEKFPWQRLHESGIGHWVRPAPITQSELHLALGDQNEAVTEVQTGLAKYGYGLALTGCFDKQMHDVVVAFQRHFRQERVDGIIDVSTLTTLHRLLQTRPAVALQDVAQGESP